MTIKKISLVVAALMSSLLLGAQTTDKLERLNFGLEYNSELQSNFKNAKWVNLLRADLSVTLVDGLSLNAATLSTAQTDETPLINDLQGFSNIEAENIPLTLAVLSLDWETKHTTLSVGIRNFNENYFATPLTSFFTQSSHGIFPTISANFPIANYPLASLGVDFQWRIKDFSLDASLYNGTGYKDFIGRENLFRFRPKSDGVFTALQLSHEAGYGSTHIGAALRAYDKTARGALWAYTELNLGAKAQLLAQYSFAPGTDVECKHHASLGFKYDFGKVAMGMAENFARFIQFDENVAEAVGINEWATELIVCVPISPNFSVKPVFHFCHTHGHSNCVGLLRLTIEL